MRIDGAEFIALQISSLRLTITYTISGNEVSFMPQALECSENVGYIDDWLSADTWGFTSLPRLIIGSTSLHACEFRPSYIDFSYY